MIRKNKFIKLFIAIFLFISLFFVYQYHRTEPVVSLAISSDGRYVISVHGVKEFFSFQLGQQLVLWDIEKKEKKVLATNAEGFTTAFVPDSHEFMWQDSNNVVHIQNVDGKEILSFQHFPVIGHIISADKDFYLSANKYGQLYKGYGENMVPIYTDGGVGIPMSLSMSKDYFLSTGNAGFPENAPVAETNLTANPINPNESKKSSYDGVTLWDRHTLKPIARLWGNSGKTTGLISPDGKWVVTGGENHAEYMWEIHNLSNRLNLAKIDRGVYQKETGKYDKGQLLPVPNNLKDKQIAFVNTIAIAFLTEKDFIMVGESGDKDGFGEELVRLFTVGDPWIKAYVEIGNDPSISTDSYGKNLSVSSAPKAHILVTGQATGGGINVYKYHPDKMELEKIWVAD
ncbi:WD40 repeat domain-containing protein [Exercitatus varius]|uniref:WD40 repeat domain-containing protein n=1 Tax=Exercitatus varius TaxID=67857 RepID=UPI00294AFFAC|nr:WD40 repeat domain-containing protein [Exercitatus varius]MDG2953099.1 WD40 repeat domain-containing protein [Exercitatus varius]